MELSRLLFQRTIRVLSKDSNLPLRCYASMYYDYELKQCNCDCIIFCKLPPKGPPSSEILIDQSNKDYKLEYLHDNIGVYYFLFDKLNHF